MNSGSIVANYDPAADFRSKATFGVAVAAMLLLFPIAVLDLYQQEYAIGIGALGISFILAANAWIIKQGRCHQNLTAFGLIPAGMIFMISVFYSDGYIGSLWCFPSIIACYCMLSQRRAWLGNLCVLSVAIPMVWITLDNAYALRITATLSAISLFSAILVHVIDEQRSLLQQQLVRDPLTGLHNRLLLQPMLRKVCHSHNERGTPACLLAIDIDHFKRINDSQGHEEGDRVLITIAAVLKEVLRESDMCFRTGGEEFLVLLTSTTETGAVEVAERLRSKISTLTTRGGTRITVSVGVSSHQCGESWSEWAKRTDDRLYSAKRRGRNNVVATRYQQTRTPRLYSLP